MAILPTVDREAIRRTAHRAETTVRRVRRTTPLEATAHRVAIVRLAVTARLAALEAAARTEAVAEVTQAVAVTVVAVVTGVANQQSASVFVNGPDIFGAVAYMHNVDWCL